MARSKNFSKVFNTIFPFADFLYILQQEDYSTRRYMKWLPRFFWRRNFQLRDHIRYTRRATSMLIFIILIWLLSLGIILAFVANIFFSIMLALLWLIGIPIIVGIGSLILEPYYTFLKRRVFKKAGERIQNQKNLRIIVIAGSFGKTTTKNFVYQLVRHNYRAQMIPGNINTPLGIANWILSDLRIGTELLIVEIDGYSKNEFVDSGRIVPADIAIITNIGDQHLERFGSKENLAVGLGEVFRLAKPNAVLLANLSTKEKLKDASYTMTVPSHEVKDNLNHFSASSREDLVFAIKTAELLNIPNDFIVHACENMEIPERRQKVTQRDGYDCIDDSYNISFTTAQAGIAAAGNLAKMKHKKLLAVTAGIPELGPDNKDDNKNLGELLARTTDHVVILKSMFAGDISRGVADPEKYNFYPDFNNFLADAHAKFSPEQWVLFIQPELTDLYY